jgi:hypothetical protein
MTTSTSLLDALTPLCIGRSLPRRVALKSSLEHMRLLKAARPHAGSILNKVLSLDSLQNRVSTKKKKKKYFTCFGQTTRPITCSRA